MGFSGRQSNFCGETQMQRNQLMLVADTNEKLSHISGFFGRCLLRTLMETCLNRTGNRQEQLKVSKGTDSYQGYKKNLPL